MTFKEEYVQILGPGHWVYLIGFAIASYCLYAKRHVIRRHRDRADKILAIVVIAQQLLLYTTYVFLYDFDLAESLPFHICRITSIFILLYLLTKKRHYYIIGTAFGIFALLSFLYPTDVVPINHPIGLSFFISHTVNLLFGIYGHITAGYMIENRDILTAMKAFFVYFFFVYLFNPLVGGNYFYFRDKPVFGDLPDLFYVPVALATSLLLIFIGMKFFIRLDERMVKGDETVRPS